MGKAAVGMDGQTGTLKGPPEGKVTPNKHRRQFKVWQNLKVRLRWRGKDLPAR